MNSSFNNAITNCQNKIHCLGYGYEKNITITDVITINNFC